MGAKKPKDLNRIAKISRCHPYVREETLVLFKETVNEYTYVSSLYWHFSFDVKQRNNWPTSQCMLWVVILLPVTLCYILTVLFTNCCILNMIRHSCSTINPLSSRVCDFKCITQVCSWICFINCTLKSKRVTNYYHWRWNSWNVCSYLDK